MNTVIKLFYRPQQIWGRSFEFLEDTVQTCVGTTYLGEPVMADGDTAATPFLSLTSEIVAAYVSNNPVPANGLPNMIESVHGALKDIVLGESAGTGNGQKPAVTVKKSVMPDYIICLEDGKKLKMLKRYLRSRYGLSPDEYRVKWHLPPDYPMVAAEYAARRSAFAKKIGLGRTRRGAGRRGKRG